MARETKLSAAEIAELDETKRREHRNRGFYMMSIRDRGWAKLKDAGGKDVTMLWHVDEARREEGVTYSGVPEGMFVLEFDGKKLAFDAEEFRKSFRWV